MKSSNDKIKILFLPGLSTSFIKNDYEILKKHFIVSQVNWHGKRDIFKILKKVINKDLVFVWFASDHAGISVFLAKLFGKKSIVVAGGYDVANIPEFNYGQFTQNWIKKTLAKFALKHADIILPVSNYVKNEISKILQPKKLEVVYNGVNTEKFIPKKKEKIIVTIGPVTKTRMKLKGLDTFSKVSVNFPDYKFVIIGETEEPLVKELKKINPNLIFAGKISHEKVIEYLQKALIYCQLSYIESFGMGIAEAMSCECIPVVTKKGGLPEVVGDNGFFVQYGDINSTINAIDKIIKDSKETKNLLRKRIKEIFSLKKREGELVSIIRSLVK